MVSVAVLYFLQLLSITSSLLDHLWSRDAYSAPVTLTSSIQSTQLSILRRPSGQQAFQWDSYCVRPSRDTNITLVVTRPPVYRGRVIPLCVVSQIVNRGGRIKDYKPAAPWTAKPIIKYIFTSVRTIYILCALLIDIATWINLLHLSKCLSVRIMR